jgi:hypothetical protein
LTQRQTPRLKTSVRWQIARPLWLAPPSKKKLSSLSIESLKTEKRIFLKKCRVAGLTEKIRKKKPATEPARSADEALMMREWCSLALMKFINATD